MAFTQTVQTVLDRVAYLADIRGQVAVSSAARHPQADVIGLILDDYRKTRVFATGIGFSELLQATNPSPLPTTVSAGDTGEQFVRVPTPTGSISVRGLDVLSFNNIWLALESITWQQRRNLEVQTSRNSLPRYWAEIDAGSVAGSVFTPGSIGIFPKPQKSSNYRIWYLPEYTETSQLTDLLFYIDQSWYDYHVSTVALKIAGIRDNDAKGRVKNLTTMQAEAISVMRAMIPKRQLDQSTAIMRSDNYNGWTY